MNRFTLTLMVSICLTSVLYAQYHVAIVKSGNAEPYVKAIDGVRAELKRNYPAAIITEYDLPYQPSVAPPPDVIISVGSKATDELAHTIDTIPIVYMMTMTHTNPKSNMTGVSLTISPRQQFTLFKKIVPHAKRIGVIYSPKKTREIVETGSQDARELGMEIVKTEVIRLEEVYSAIRSIGPNVDALWMVPDTTVYNAKSTEDILLFCLRERLPVIGLSSTYVQSGALCARSCDYHAIGVQSARMTLKLLHGEAPSQIPPEEPAETDISVNLSVAERNDIVIPDSILQEATNVYK